MDGKSRANVVWVPLEEVIPNPLNPRKNDAIRTEEMQEILLSKGWEEPLTVYKRGKFYIVLAGHRRLYAAKQTRTIKEVPVYIVDPPETHQDEIERIASLQKGRVDWEPYEWAKFTYERWIAWGKPPIRDFAKKISVGSFSTVSDYITVLEYFPRYEVESGLANKTYNMSVLATLAEWIKKLKASKPTFVESLTEDLIRRNMLNKMGNRLASREALRLTRLFDVVTERDLLNFFNTGNMSLQDVLNEYGIAKQTETFHGRLVVLGRANRAVIDMNIPRDESQRNSLLNSLDVLQTSIKKKIQAIKKINKEI